MWVPMNCPTKTCITLGESAVIEILFASNVPALRQCLVQDFTGSVRVTFENLVVDPFIDPGPGNVLIEMASTQVVRFADRLCRSYVEMDGVPWEMSPGTGHGQVTEEY